MDTLRSINQISNSVENTASDFAFFGYMLLLVVVAIILGIAFYFGYKNTKDDIDDIGENIPN